MEKKGMGRWRLDVRGRVQGVGFRPFVVRIASELGLSGLVGNDSHGAFIEVESNEVAVQRFVERLKAELPPLARIVGISQREITPLGATCFSIAPSETDSHQQAAITPDAATCADCLRELEDPGDRRFGYPFTNCTNCGPRYSIIHGIPYDRPQTSMASFVMCERCLGEYEDVEDRRYHAQPNACALCGPRIWFCDAQGVQRKEGPGAIQRAAAALLSGKIVAIKGLGGFHLACRADTSQAVDRLRERKGRDAKPLALMVKDISQARQLAELDASAEKELVSAAAPIVLVRRRPTIHGEPPVAEQVAPETDLLGLMVPYTPLHRLLFSALARDGSAPPLVMTSGNPSEEPLSAQNDEAIVRLQSIADAFLLHDREIARPIDDSVTMSVGDGLLPLRRARGYVPDPIFLATPSARSVLALGGDLKSTICLLNGDRAVLSEHLGDLENPAAYRNYLGAIERLMQLTRLCPEVIAKDLHPGYQSASAVQQFPGTSVVSVQHHHAHAVSCMAENGVRGPALAICCDGTGYGDDGAIWGGEILICEGARYERVGQLGYFPLFGGDAAAKETRRPACGLIFQALGARWRETMGRLGCDDNLTALAAKRMESAPPTSSLGRLFDGVAFILGIAEMNRFEGDAAIQLELAASRASEPLVAVKLALDLETAHGRLNLDTGELIRRLIKGREEGLDPQALALGFHQAVADGFAKATGKIAQGHGLKQVVLSGGCMLNRILYGRLRGQLEAQGLTVYRHRHVPPGDGGISLGQAVIAAQV